MTEGAYAELHARSAFSFLEGASSPEALAEACAAAGCRGMAVLDRDNISGAVRFHRAAEAAGLRAHVGAEVTADDGNRYPLLVESQRGYRNLCRLISSYKLRAKKGEGAATRADFETYSEDLICLTGDERGPLAAALKDGSGRECLERLVSLFGRRNVYVELQRHADRSEEARNLAAMELAETCGLPLIATNGSRHATAEERELLDVLTCVRHKVKMGEAGRLLNVNSERHVKTPEEMRRLFADVPEAVANAAELSGRLDYTLAELGYEFPPYPVPEGETMNSFLRKRTDEGARARYRPYTERARRQIERELSLIEQLNLAGYFLIVWDLVRYCRTQGILVQGRGSAANSAVCYSLGITAVDPVEMELLFERFLSEERDEWPDIDLDLPSGDRRERVIQYVYQRYGERGAAMTANVITYRGRSAVRDVGKVLGFGETEIGRLSKLVPSWGWDGEGPTTAERFRDAGLSLDDKLAAKFVELYGRIKDLPRHLGQHSGGMIICQGRLDSVVPLEPATMPGRVVVQWDKDDCADAKIIKVDLLGLGMMAVLQDTIQIVGESYGETLDLAHIPKGDEAVYSALGRADTVGWFQVESRAQMSVLPRMLPVKFYDLVVQVAIIRPGPIVGQMLNPYLQRRRGREDVTYQHPALEPILKRTLGVPLFQEQILRMAMTVAGFTGGEAEELRRACSFKRSKERMREIEVKLRRGMEANGIRGDAQEQIVKSITSFALYGFPESHAASFALLAYFSGYLKCHYLAAFMAATLNNQPMGFYSAATLIKDAQRHGLRFRPIDVTRSGWRCAVEEDAGGKWVRLGLNYVQGVRSEACFALLDARGKSPFESIGDLARRVPELRKDELRKLARVGALNFIKEGRQTDRRASLWNAELAKRPAGPMFEETATKDEPSPLRPMDEMERVNADYEGSGVTIGKHPMTYYRNAMDELGVTPAARLARVRNGRYVVIAGSVICRQRPGTAKGLVFLSLEDETGVANAVVMPDVFQRYRLTILAHHYLIVKGVLQNIDGVVTVKAAAVAPLGVAAARLASHDFH
jgi:error-prone DNA polymerase